MKTISFYQDELQKVMDVRARHMKESIERKLEISQARMALNRKLNAQNIKQEDLECDYKYTQMKINSIITNRKMVLAATALRRPSNNKITVSMLNKSLLNGAGSHNNMSMSYISPT